MARVYGLLCICVPCPCAPNPTSALDETDSKAICWWKDNLQEVTIFRFEVVPAKNSGCNKESIAQVDFMELTLRS